jgi:regulatory protein spx
MKGVIRRMIKLYTRPTCRSSGRAKEWLLSHKLSFQEKVVIFHDVLSKQELFHILSLTDCGVEEIIAKRSKFYSDMKDCIQNKNLDDLLSTLNDCPSLLRTPIIVDSTHLQIGFNEEGIRKFIPRNERKVIRKDKINNLKEMKEFY